MNRDMRQGSEDYLRGKPYNPNANIDWQTGWLNARADEALDA